MARAKQRKPSKRRTQGTGPLRTAQDATVDPAIPHDLALQVFESLSDDAVIRMLCESKTFIESCREEQRLKAHMTPRAAALFSYMDRQHEWLRKVHPAYPVDVLLNSDPTRGFRPPRWVREWEYAGFDKWREAAAAGSPESLESALGIKGARKKGAVEKGKRLYHLLALFADLASLMALGPMKAPAAARLIACRDNPTLRAAAATDAKSADGLEAKARSLTEEFNRFPGRTELRKHLQARWNRTPRSGKIKFVESFPLSEVLSTDLRRFLS